MKTELYKITTLSNLHVGSGDINFDVIDNQVQRDAIVFIFWWIELYCEHSYICMF